MNALTATTVRQTYVDPYPGHKGEDLITFTCWKCAGRGRIDPFGNVYGGICFSCNGNGSLWRKVKNLRASEHRRVNEHNKTVDAEERAAAYLSDNPEIAQAFEMMPSDNDFASSLKASILRNGSLSDRQRAALIKASEREIAKIEAHANTKPVPTGRVQITGKVISLKWRDSGYGYSLKAVIVSEEGWKVWGTVPAKFEEDVDRGAQVSFIATVEASQDDETFGFYKRPAKFEIEA